jgi:hypothetical protein
MSASAMESAFAGYLQEHAPIFSLRLDDNGNVIAANRFATQLGDSSPVGKHFREVFLFLDATTTLQTLCNESGKLHLLHVGTRAGLPETFRVQFFPWEGEMLVFGTLDADETMQLRKELLEVNSQLNLLTRDLQKSKHELEEALANVKTLKGLLPICCHCKKIRDDQGYWSQVEVYIHNHSEADFSHGICPDCVKELYPEEES